MKIKEDKRYIRGEHKTHEFTYEGGHLEMFGKKWNRCKIELLVEVANLLELEGFKLDRKEIKMRKMTQRDWLTGATFSHYVEDDGETREDQDEKD